MGKLNIAIASVLPKLNYKVNLIPIKMPAGMLGTLTNQFEMLEE